MDLAASIAAIFKKPFTPHRVKALWDTGASGTAVSSRFADSIGLPAIDRTQVHGAGGIHESRVFSIDLLIPGTPVRVDGIEVTEFKDNGAFDVLIGMDIITMGDFCITNANGETTFSYRTPPNAFPIDFVAQIQKDVSSRDAIKRFKKKQR